MKIRKKRGNLSMTCVRESGGCHMRTISRDMYQCNVVGNRSRIN